MRRLLQFALLLAAFAWCAPVRAGSTHRVACWGNTEDSAPASTQTLAVTPTGGTGHILIAFARSNLGVVTHTVTDNSGSNTWSSLVGSVANSDDSDNAAMSIAYDVAGGSYTLTDTLGAARSFRSMSACEYSGMASPALDGSAAGGVPESGQNSQVVTGAFSTANAANVISLMATYSCTSCTRSNGTIAGTSVTPTATADDAMVYDLDTTATFSSQTCTAASSTANGWVAICVGLKQSAGGGGPAPQVPSGIVQTSGPLQTPGPLQPPGPLQAPR